MLPRRLHRLFAPLLLGATVLAVPPAAAAADASPTLERIKRSGTITFGYRDGARPFSFAERGQVRGYSADLCRRVADAVQKELGLPRIATKWVPVDADSRLAAVASGRVDAECGTTTVTLERMKTVDFSLPIFVDGGTVLVGGKSGVRRLADLGGKDIAVIGGTTTEAALRRALATLGVAATLRPVPTGKAGMALLATGKVAGYAGDRVVLTAFRASEPGADYAFIEGDFSVEPYALVLPRNDADFRLAVNRVLAGLYRSGEIDPIFERWLSGLGQPSALLHALFYLNTLPE